MYKIKEAEDGTTYLYHVLTGALAAIVNAVPKERNGLNDRKLVLNTSAREPPEAVKDGLLSRSPRKSSLCVEDFAARNRTPYQNQLDGPNNLSCQTRETRSRQFFEQLGKDCPCRASQSELDEDCLEKETFFKLFDLKPSCAPTAKCKPRNPACFCGRENPPDLDMADLKTYYSLIECSSTLGRWSLRRLRQRFPNSYDAAHPNSANFLRYELCCRTAAQTQSAKPHALRKHDAPLPYPVTYHRRGSDEDGGYCRTYQFNGRQRKERRTTLRTGLNRRSRELKQAMNGLTVRLVRLTDAEVDAALARTKPEPTTAVGEPPDSDANGRLDVVGSGAKPAENPSHPSCRGGGEPLYRERPAPQSRKVWNLRRCNVNVDLSPDRAEPSVGKVTELARRCSIPLDDISDLFRETNVEDNLEPATGDNIALQSYAPSLAASQQQEKEDCPVAVRLQTPRKLCKVFPYAKDTVERAEKVDGRGDYTDVAVREDDESKAGGNFVIGNRLRRCLQRRRIAMMDNVENNGGAPQPEGDYLSCEKEAVAKVRPASPSTPHSSSSSNTRSFNLRSGSSNSTKPAEEGNGDSPPRYEKMVSKYMACGDARTFTPRKHACARTSPRNRAAAPNPDAAFSSAPTPVKIGCASPARDGAGKWVSERPMTRAKSNGQGEEAAVVVVNGVCESPRGPVTKCYPTRSGRSRRESVVKKATATAKCRFIFKCRGCGIEKTYLSKGAGEAAEIVSSHVAAVHKGDKVSLSNCEKRFGDMVTTVAEVTVKRKPGSQEPSRKSLRVIESRHR